MEKHNSMEMTKIKKIAEEIKQFPETLDSVLAKKARQLLKKYALLSEKIEKNVVVRYVHRKELAIIRSLEFKTIRQKLKVKANSIINPGEKKPVKAAKTPPKKTEKVSASKPEVKQPKKSKESKTKEINKTEKKEAPKVKKAATPKKQA